MACNFDVRLNKYAKWTVLNVMGVLKQVNMLIQHSVPFSVPNNGMQYNRCAAATA